MITTITLTITHKKAISDLLDKVAGRTYTLDGVDDVSAITDAGWMPIESAPKDGTYILLGSSDGAWVARYHPIYQSGYMPENPWQSMMLNHEHLGRYPKAKPTHYMPLPHPPKEQA